MKDYENSLQFHFLLLVDFDRFLSDLSGNKQANSAETGA